jgi:hypothetical protein
MEWSLFQDSQETIHSADKKANSYESLCLCIDKKKIEKPNNQNLKTKQNVIFQLCQFSIFFV